MQVLVNVIWDHHMYTHIISPRQNYIHQTMMKLWLMCI